MRLEDLSVEVRDKTAKRIGIIGANALNLHLTVVHNNVGSWSISLPAEHPLTDSLKAPGSGLIVRDKATVIASGPSIRWTYSATPMDPEGSVAFDGLSDDIILGDMLAWPEPSNPDVSTQTLAHDTRTGPAETLMHAFVNANIGPSAPSPRRKAMLTMGPDGGRGPTITKEARFPKLGALLSEMATPYNLGYRILQQDNGLLFTTYAVRDRTSEVRLDVRNGTLSGQKLAVTAPGITRAIVAGQGEMVDRTFLAFTNSDATEAEADWGRRIEQFIDQRQTNDAAQLKQAADEALANDGFTAISVQVVPMDGDTMQFGLHWGLGDKVAVVVDGIEMVSIVTGYELTINADGLSIQATIGDPAEFNPAAALRKRILNTDSRLSKLERQ